MQDVAIAAIRTDDRYLMIQRPLQGCNAGLWCFPGMETFGGQMEKQVARLLKHRLRIKANHLRLLFKTIIDTSRFHVFLSVVPGTTVHQDGDFCVGLGWFTIPQLYSMVDSMATWQSDILPQVMFSVRHHHDYAVKPIAIGDIDDY